MTAPALVQWASADGDTVTLGSPVTAGNLLVVVIVLRSQNGVDVPLSGYGLSVVAYGNVGPPDGGGIKVAHKLPTSGTEGTTFTFSMSPYANEHRVFAAEFSGVGSWDSATGGVSTDGSEVASHDTATATPSAGLPGLLFLPLGFTSFHEYTLAASGWTKLAQDRAQGFHPTLAAWYQATATTSGSYSAHITNTGTSGQEDTRWCSLMLAYVGADPDVPVVGPPYVPPTPGAGIVEIWAAEPGAARWDIARWDEAVWSTAGWRNVTPESVDVEVLWGSQRPELGILSKPEAGSWAIDIYDPDRILDPANVEGPYYGDLEPGLPVRLRHGELVVKQGIAESLGYQFSEEQGARDTAFLRVTDVISVLANASVPSDVTLADTLYARARDAISAASLSVTVLPDPPAGDPVLAPWETGQDLSAWDWIRDAAEQVLWMPYVTNVGFLGFRDYRTPLDRGRVLGSPNLVGLQSIIQHNGLYSVVRALQTVADGDAVITRELTPKPRYGERVFERDGRTPDASDWAFAVLNDRAQAGLRWVPGVLYPLTAADVDSFATIEAIETVGLYYPEASPSVVQEVIVVGGRITVVGKKDSEAVWTFAFEAAQTAQPALVSEDDPESFLVRDDDPTEYLYPDG